ncbi:MAG: Gfo/Idh/MocA family oxidoreductase, partial [Planctomycetota bacterium]|nr:Gfo/Idh/MocA family oxidoreductase [Planctomycetota bacterium]
MPLTFGIIGCGNILRLHWPGLQSAKAKIKWTCDLRAEAAQAWAQTCQAKPTTDWRTVIEDPEVQALDITASSAAHKEICLAAIEQGKAVICEKTLATTAEDAWEIVAQAEKRRTIFYTSYMKRFLPAVRQAKELLAEMGDIVSTHIRTHQPWGIPWREVPPDSWLAGTNRSPSKCRQAYGGGVLVCAGSHMLDLLCFFLGRPRRVAASLHIPKGADTDLFAAAFFETDNGVA